MNLNNLDEAIQFAMETSNQKLPFIDKLINIRDNKVSVDKKIQILNDVFILTPCFHNCGKQ